MNRALPIILTLALLLSPASALLGYNCDCAGNTAEHAALNTTELHTTEVDSFCCPAAPTEQSTQDQPPQDKHPCNGCDCPIPCCSTGKTIAIAQHTKRATFIVAHVLPSLHPDLIQAPPHLTRLKRPPRPVNLI